MQRNIWIGIFIGSTTGSFIPLLWGGDVFSYAGIWLGAAGAFVGIWLGYRMST